jgi:hypothetical protein
MSYSGTISFFDDRVTINFDAEFAKLKSDGEQKFLFTREINKIKFLERISSEILIKVYKGTNCLFETHNTQNLNLPDNTLAFVFSKQKPNLITARENLKVEKLQHFYKQYVEPKLSNNTQIHTALYDNQDNLVAESYGAPNFCLNTLSQPHQKLNILVESIQTPAEYHQAIE